MPKATKQKRAANTDPEERMAAQAQFAEVLAEILKETGATQSAIAKAFKVTDAMVSNWKKVGGRHEPPDGWRKTLAGFLTKLAATNSQRAEAGIRIAAKLNPPAKRKPARTPPAE